MRTEVVVTTVNHYDMGDNRGLSVRILGDKSHTNNKFGVEISEANVPNYQELSYLAQYAEELPAKFECTLSLSMVKDRNGKEKTGVALKDFKFICPVQIVDVKQPVKA